MDDMDRPNLSLGDLAELADDLYEMDKELWEVLRPMLMSDYLNDNVPLPIARPPRLTAKFYYILANFSEHAFENEVRKYPRYPPNPNFNRWLLNLAKRVEDHSISVVSDIEASDTNKSFAYHDVNEPGIRHAICERLSRCMKDRHSVPPAILAEAVEGRKHCVAPTPPLELRHERSVPLKDPPLPQTFSPALTGEQISAYQRAGIDTASPAPLVVALHNSAQANSQVNPGTVSPEEVAISSERAALRDTYRAAFPDVKIADIIWAAKQTRREWYRWIGGESKNGLKPDRSFRHVLTSRKSPEQIMGKPRPTKYST